MYSTRRYVVIEQDDKYITNRVNDCFGIFYSYERAETLLKQQQKKNPHNSYTIRELLHGGVWLDKEKKGKS